MPNRISVQVEDDQVVSIQVDGVNYSRVEQIPDRKDRARVQRIITAQQQARQVGQAFGFPSWIPTLFLGITVLLLIITAVSTFLILRSLGQEAYVSGRVVDLVLDSPNEGEVYYYPVIEFYLPDGTLQSVQVADGRWPAAYEQGELVQVAYDPADPSRARINSISSLLVELTLPLITGLMGLIFLGTTFFVRWILKTTAGLGESTQ